MPDPPSAGAASLSFQYSEFMNNANALLQLFHMARSVLDLPDDHVNDGGWRKPQEAQLEKVNELFSWSAALFDSNSFLQFRGLWAIVHSEQIIESINVFVM